MSALTIQLPSKMYFRRGEVRGLFGFSEEEMTKLIRAETLKPVHFAGSKRAHFARQDLQKLIPNAPASLTGNHSATVPPATHASVPKTTTRPGAKARAK